MKKKLFTLEEIKEIYACNEHPCITSPQHEALRQLIEEVERLKGEVTSIDLDWKNVQMENDHLNSVIVELQAENEALKKVYEAGKKVYDVFWNSIDAQECQEAMEQFGEALQNYERLHNGKTL